MEVLPASQQRLWPQLRPAPGLGLVLYGGTAIALHLGHRSSVDFDFFTDRPLDKSALMTAFPFLAQSTVLQDQPDTLTALSDTVKVSFFGSLGIGRVERPKMTEDGVLQVASLDDLMATKLKVMLQRVDAKDYKDVAAMITAGVGLPKGLAAAREMFRPTFQPSESLKALVYFEGGDLHTLTSEDKHVLISASSAVRELPRVAIVSRQLAA